MMGMVGCFGTFSWRLVSFWAKIFWGGGRFGWLAGMSVVGENNLLGEVNLDERRGFCGE